MQLLRRAHVVLSCQLFVFFHLFYSMTVICKQRKFWKMLPSFCLARTYISFTWFWGPTLISP